MIAVSPAADRGRCGNSDDVEEKRAKEGEAAAAVGWGHLYEMAGETLAQLALHRPSKLGVPRYAPGGGKSFRLVSES